MKFGVILKTPMTALFLLLLSFSVQGAKLPSVGDKVLVDEGAQPQALRVKLTGGVYTVKALGYNGRVVVFHKNDADSFILRRSQYTRLADRGFKGIKVGDKVFVDEGTYPQGLSKRLTGGLWTVKAIDVDGRIVVFDKYQSDNFILTRRQYTPLAKSPSEPELTRHNKSTTEKKSVSTDSRVHGE
jgi:hypothetical protein